MATIYYASPRPDASLTTAAAYAAVFAGTNAVAEPEGYDITVPFAFSTAVLTTPHLFVVNDTVQLVKIPKGAVITGWHLYMPDVDSATSSELDLGLLHAGTAAFVLQSTIGRTAGFISSEDAASNGIVAGAIPYTVVNTAVATQADGGDTFQLLAHTAGAGAGAGGTIIGWVRYQTRSSNVF